jgi:hypothetical protein
VDIESRSDLRHRPRHAASTKAEDAIERYLLAFAAGTMPESTCSQRVPDCASAGPTSTPNST